MKQKALTYIIQIYEAYKSAISISLEICHIFPSGTHCTYYVKGTEGAICLQYACAHSHVFSLIWNLVH